MQPPSPAPASFGTRPARPSEAIPFRLRIAPILSTARIAEALRDLYRDRTPGQPLALRIESALADGDELPADVRLPEELEELGLASAFPGYGTHGRRRTIFSNGIASLLPSCARLRTLDLSLSHADTTGLERLFLGTRLQSLSALRIHAARFYPDFFDDLAAGAPNLESLELDRCSFFVYRRGLTEVTWGTNSGWGEAAGALHHVRTLVIREPDSNLSAAHFISGLAKFPRLRSMRLQITGASVVDLPKILHALSPSAQSLEELVVKELCQAEVVAPDCPSPFGLGQSGGCRRPSGSASFQPSPFGAAPLRGKAAARSPKAKGARESEMKGFAEMIHARLLPFRRLRSLSVGTRWGSPWGWLTLSLRRYGHSAAVLLLDALRHSPIPCPSLESLSLPLAGVPEARTLEGQRREASARTWAEIEAEVLRFQEQRVAGSCGGRAPRGPSPLFALPANTLHLIGEYCILGTLRVD
jgi:hypothetical protein